LNKTPRFFFDICGHEVGNDIKTCPYCGRYFASIRCPKCGFSGEDSLFVNGCPSCGYSASPVPEAQKALKTPKKKRSRKKKTPTEEPLPSWVYLVLIASLFAVIAVLSYFITR
jgi:uncharacterized membrane protein YvbJ